MAKLFCKRHGREHEARVMGNSAIYREEGESVLIVSGTLSTGPWLCDSGGCHAELHPGDAATFLASFPRRVTESIYEYDFAYERQYFAMRGTEKVAVYGAAWPCGDPAAWLGQEVTG